MEYTPHNAVLVELNRQKLKAYIGDTGSARLLLSAILEPITLVKSMQRLLLGNFTGIILLDLADIQKVVYVKNAEVVFARSSVNDERLGETLCRMGKLTINALNRASKEITPNRRLGKVLVENKYITSRELWLGVKRQIFEIWGSYARRPQEGQPSAWFHVIQTDIDETNMVKPNSTMLDSLFEYLREQVESLQITIMDDDLVHLHELTNAVTFNEFEDSILKYLSRENDRTVAMVAKEINADESSTETALKPLVYAGILSLIKQPATVEEKTEDARIEELVQLTNTIMTSIAVIMRAKAPDVDFTAVVQDYVRSSGSMFKECTINKQGCFDMASLMDIYRNSSLLSPYDETAGFIRELIQFELFEMKNYLRKEQTEELEKIIEALG